MSSLLASPRYFFQSISSCLPYPSVITFFQFVVSYFTRIFCQMSHSQFSSWLFLCFPFPIFLRIHIVFSQFDATYFTHVMYTNCQIPIYLLVCFFFASPFSVPILPFHCLRISVPSFNTRYYLQNLVFRKFFFNPKVFFPFHPSPRLFAICFQTARLSCCRPSITIIYCMKLYRNDWKMYHRYINTRVVSKDSKNESL